MDNRVVSQAYARYLKLLGIDYLPRIRLHGEEEIAPSALSEDLQARGKLLHQLVDLMGDCTRCRLNEGRRNIVFGEGSACASLMFIGEGPGAEEDRLGRPFVGAAGKRLNQWIKKLELNREEVYIANIVKCRPPGNRAPRPDEAATCIPFLKRQIEIINPSLIVTLGAPALNFLLQRTEKITRVRGTLFEYEGTALMPTFHPAYILRNPIKEKEVFLDLERIKKILGNPCP